MTDYDLSNYIIDRAWNDLKSANIRDCERIAKLASNSSGMVDLLIENVCLTMNIDV